MIAEPRTQNSKTLEIEDWGLIPYQEALDRQLKYVEEVSSGTRPDTVVFCTHPPVVTLGRATVEGDVTDWSGEVIEVSRGGRATYHGPDQFVVYPIIDLNHRGKDLNKHLRWIEEVVIVVLKEFGVDAIREPGSTGVWTNEKKICSIGIAVKKWVSFHGLSLAVDKDENAYRGINPCGFSRSVMTSLEEVTGHKVDRTQLKKYFLNVLA
jgi:lipoyl(octanoyl) transferase